MILAIDPGPTQSAWVEYDEGRPVDFGIDDNERVLWVVAEALVGALAIEQVRSYGRPVGQETFETCRWYGRFEQRWLDHGGRTPVLWIPRLEVRQHICHHGNATDAHIRQALIDRYGPGKDVAIGKKATPGPLYGVTSHVWSALAVAVTAADTAKREDVAA